MLIKGFAVFWVRCDLYDQIIFIFLAEEKDKPAVTLGSPFPDPKPAGQMLQARKVAAKVTKYRRSVTLEPMNAYERHVIHTALQDVPCVTTYSTGTEPNRRVIVAYDREKK